MAKLAILDKERQSLVEAILAEEYVLETGHLLRDQKAKPIPLKKIEKNGERTIATRRFARREYSGAENMCRPVYELFRLAKEIAVREGADYATIEDLKFPHHRTWKFKPVIHAQGTLTTYRIKGS